MSRLRLSDGAAPLLRRHRVFVALFAVGLLLRVLVTLAYTDVIMFYGDSWKYVEAAQRGIPSFNWPFGYSLLLRALSWTTSLRSVAIAQHVGGLCLALLIYRFLLARGVRTWVAAIATAPVLLDGYQIALEQYVMSETLFELLLVGGLVLALRRTATWVSVLGASGLFAAAMLTRAVALPVAIVCLVYFGVRRIGWQRVVAGTAVVVLAYAGYGAWFRHYHREFGITESNSHFLYGRVAPFADCRGLSLSEQERVLCKKLKSNTPTAYTWSGRSPFFTLAHRYGARHADAVASSFDRKVILHQPFTYLRVVTLDTLHFFSPVRTTSGGDFPVAAWRLPTRVVKRSGELGVSAMNFEGDWARPHVDTSLARAMLDYQRVAYTYGPLLAAGLLLAALAAVRRRGDPDEPVVAERIELALLVVVSGVLLVLPNATVLFDWRYLLPAIPVIPTATALAAGRLWPRRFAEVEPPLPPTASPRRELSAAVAGGVACLLALLAPLHHNTLYSGYVLAGAALSDLGAPVGRPLPIPGSPHLRYQMYEHGWLAEAEGHGTAKIPPGISAQLTDATWSQLGAPRACGHLEADPSVRWCYFARGLLTSPAGLQDLVPPLPQPRH